MKDMISVETELRSSGILKVRAQVAIEWNKQRRDKVAIEWF